MCISLWSSSLFYCSLQWSRVLSDSRTLHSEMYRWSVDGEWIGSSPITVDSFLIWPVDLDVYQWEWLMNLVPLSSEDIGCLRWQMCLVLVMIQWRSIFVSISRWRVGARLSLIILETTSTARGKKRNSSVIIGGGRRREEKNAKVLRAINILTAISSLSLSYLTSTVIKNNRYFDADELPTDLVD